MKCQNGTCEHTAFNLTLSRLRHENEALAADYAAFKALAKEFRECKVDIGNSLAWPMDDLRKPVSDLMTW